MDRNLLARHLGFLNWRELLTASERVPSEDGRVWYAVQTPTWYKWVLWNMDGDVYFHFETRSRALRAMQPS
ncbi:hypothetical protein JZ785_22005 [Alicyclobacillus curvatus]|jgi:hypothetical protein|nr:hypothetical protein JZ785_22005 [Alicyclobacillus curvatus]